MGITASEQVRGIPRAILFDLDGVLIDSYPVWLRLVNQAARELGYPEISHETYQACWGQSTRADRDAFFPNHDVADVERFYDAHYFEHIDRLRVPGDVTHVFRSLKELALPSAVVTNTQTSLAGELVKRSGATPDVIVGGTDVALGKPAPDMLLLALERLAVAPAFAWMVGDSVYDLEAARAANVHFVGLGIQGDATLSRLSDVLELISDSKR